ncbi:hypothetical protein IGI04_003652 [Brassica rapa subsp. trilocularis]|uniref:Uncharacterized protein n=1 Tax=Brassica rapa subsp. trilocularis TaxID=1813537 RepID=A0ABQ7NZ17_BRACM|nr:hypothetical protein IGI04_003652 [Brassica rapa subsp. trilocularis]
MGVMGSWETKLTENHDQMLTQNRFLEITNKFLYHKMQVTSKSVDQNSLNSIMNLPARHRKCHLYKTIHNILRRHRLRLILFLFLFVSYQTLFPLDNYLFILSNYLVLNCVNWITFPLDWNGLRLHRSKMVRLTIWDNEAANFRELNRISTRKNQIVIITSIIPRLHEGNKLNKKFMSN